MKHSGILPMEGSNGIPYLDIGTPKSPVTIEIDRDRGVLHVHIEGATVLRVSNVGEFVLQDSIKGTPE